MFQIRDLHYHIGDRKLLSGINWVINPGERVALVGPNGCGKTTLLRILNGEIEYARGAIIKPKAYKIGYLPQEEIALEQNSVLQTVIEGQKDILELGKKITELHNNMNSSVSNHDELLKQLGVLEEQYESMGGYGLEIYAKNILSGLGFSKDVFSLPLSNLSGGMRMRVYLARILIKKPDILLLDEPSNHLDLQSLEWLEYYILNFSGSVVIVSHDRFFIDRLAQKIYELERGTLNLYKGNYHSYREQKRKNEELIQKKRDEQRLERERVERFINRFRYKATKAAQVQSRIKQLEKIDKIDLPEPPVNISFELSVTEKSYKNVLEIEDMSFKYIKEYILENIYLNIYRGEKIALVGINGAGKTTLTQLINQQLKPQSSDSIKIGKKTSVGYYAQHRIDELDLDKTVYDEVSSTSAYNLIPKIRDILGLFKFKGNDVFKKVKFLSGGEKARVSLAKILLSPVNFLIMDEPTNHLDIVSKEALEFALSNYNGTVLLISHDRYFLDKIVNRVIEINNKHIIDYNGNYSYYLQKRESDFDLYINKENKLKPDSYRRSKKEEKRLKAQARQSISKRRNQLKNEITSMEEKIYEFENRKNKIEQKMILKETYEQGAFVVSLQKEHAHVKKNLQDCYNRWEKAQLELEEILSQIS